MSYRCTLEGNPGICYLGSGGRPFSLQFGGTLDAAVVAFEIAGPEGAPVVVALGGISAHRHVCAHASNPSPGWWEGLAGPGRAIDTNRYRVLSFDYLGGGGASTSPANLGRNASCEFPWISTVDQANALASILDTLQLPKVHALVGASFGGAVGLAFAERHGSRLDRCVTIGAAHATPAMTTAWRSVQRAILQFGRETGRERRAVEIARALAIATYRSAEEFDRRFPGGPRFTDAGPVFPCEEYIQSRGRDFADRFDAQTYHRLSLALDLHSATPENITVPVAVVAAEPDSIAPAALLRELAARLAGPSAFVAIPSIYGHDAFLKETETVGAILRAVLESPPRDIAACASVEVLR